MKSLFILLLIFSSSFCHSQNWSPINTSERFNYQIDTSSYITNTLWVDSVKIVNSDSIFYMNKIVLDCMECAWNLYPLLEYKIANQGQFFQDRIIKEDNGIYRFEGNHTFTLKTQSNLNENWIFDSTTNVIATTVDLYEIEIFGEIDSARTIQLSNGDTIILSKNHGLNKFQTGNHQYELKGIEGRNIGEILPRFWDFYNFDIGDVFQYEHKFITYESGSLWQTGSLVKYEIISKQVDPTGYLYGVFQVSNTSQTINSVTYPISSSQGIDTFFFEYSPYHYTELYNRTLVKYNEYELCSDFIRHYMGVYKDSSDQRVVKKTGNPFPYELDKETSYNFVNYYAPLDMLSDTLVVETCAASFYYEFKEGIGLIFSSLGDFESGRSSTLVGYVKGIDTVGIISADTDILVNSQQTIENEIQVSLYPNPIINDILYINMQVDSDIQIDVLNMNGKIIHSLPSKSMKNITINLKNQADGIYIVRLSNQDIVKSFKILKH